MPRLCCARWRVFCVKLGCLLIAPDRADRAHPVMLDWFDDPEQRRLTGTILNKGEAQNVLARVAPLRWEHISLTGDYL